MITYMEKGPGLHLAIQQAGQSLVEMDGVWVASDDAAVQAIIDGYTVEQACEPIIAQIKDLARTKILAFLPEWRQSNFNARMNELNRDRFQREWTPDEQSEVDALQAEWDKAKAIRAASEAHEAALAALDTFRAILAYDYTTGWPED